MDYYIELYFGEQDGLQMRCYEEPAEVLWVPTIETQRKITSGDLDTKDIVLDRSNALPYVQTASAVDQEGDTMCAYEFCEDLLIYQDDTPSP